MTERKTSAARKRIEKLRGLFIEQLPQRFEKINQARLSLQNNPDEKEALTNLHRAVHSLKGTGLSFGFKELGKTAGKIEDLLSLCLTGTTAESVLELIPRIDDLLRELKQNITAITPAGADLPERVANPPDLSPDSVEEDVDSRAKLLYLCDDDQFIGEQLAVQLKCFGYQIVRFSELKQLSRAMSKKMPAALIMDINFPEGHYAGTELVNSMRQKFERHFPVVFISNNNDFETRLAAVKAGGSEYFTKPVNIQELVEAIDRLTERNLPEPYQILIVDDDPTVAEYNSIILQEAGMVTRCVFESTGILNVLEEFRADLVLMDMYMPRCSGYELAKLIRQIHKYAAMPIIYLSSETDKQKQLSAMRIGAEAFLSKPVDPDELIALVEIKAERMRLLQKMMVRDSMTGLYNHTTTNQLLESAIAGSLRHKAFEVCFVMIDIDLFKRVNDTYGHPLGDQVIVALARVLKQRLRGSDVVGRYGGEEFSLILQDVDLEKAAEIVDGLRKDFARLRFYTESGEFSCTFSAGIAALSKYDNFETLREAADQALYRAKQNGRNQINVA